MSKIKSRKSEESREKITSLLKKARALGARDCKLIKVSSVKTAAWVRIRCQYGCSCYGTRLTCPPYSPIPEQTQKILDCFKKAILVHGDERTDISSIVCKLERDAFLAGFYKAFSFGAGPCDICGSCSIDEGCKNPEKARPAMEACGIDVYETARKNGYKINVLRSNACKGNYFGLVLIE